MFRDAPDDLPRLGSFVSPAEPANTPTEPRSSWTTGALVASVSVVGLVFVLMRFSANDAKPMPIVTNPARPPVPTSMMGVPEPPPAQQTTASPVAPAPPTSAVPLSAIPTTPTVVEVFIMSTPAGATISRDGQPLGFAPGLISLPTTPDKATLTVSAGGYLPATLVVTPTPGKTFKVALKKAPPAPRHAVGSGSAVE